MQYVYAALLLHSAKQDVNEANIKKVVEAAGITADDAQIKALVASLDGVNIEEAISKAAVAPAAAPAAASAAPAEGEEKEEEKKDDKSEEEKSAEAAGGLAALFG